MTASEPQIGALRELPGRPGTSLCYAPHAQLHFDPDGSVSVCSKSTFRRLGRVGNVDLLALWRGPALAAIRDALREGRFPDGCEGCAWHLARGNVADHPALSFDALARDANDEWPTSLEFAFSNLCNLACIQCSSELSSTIRANRGLPPLASPYDERFFAEIEPFLAHARSLSLLGGEPFLQRECYRVTNALIVEGRRIPVHVTTNGTVFDRRVERMLAELPVSLAVSLDGVSTETIERIRVGARAEVLRANLRRFAAYVDAHAPTQRLTLNFCLMRENWSELPDLFQLARELRAEVWITPVTHPIEHSLFGLPIDALREIVASLRVRRSEVLRGASAEHRRVWESLEEMLASAVSQASEAARHGVWTARTPLSRLLARAEAGDPRGALAELERLARTEAPRAVAFLRAWIRIELGEESAASELATIAAESLDAVASVLPDGAMGCAWKLMARGLSSAALSAASCTPREDRWYARSLLFRAGILIERHEFADAETLLEEAGRVGDRSLEWWMRRAWLHFRRNEIAPGLAAVAEGERIRERTTAPEPWLVVGLHSARANLERAAGNADAALRAIDALLAIAPRDAEAQKFRAEVLADSSGSLVAEAR